MVKNREVNEMRKLKSQVEKKTKAVSMPSRRTSRFKMSSNSSRRPSKFRKFQNAQSIFKKSLMGSLMGSKRQSGRVSRRPSSFKDSFHGTLAVSSTKEEFLYKNQQFLSV